MLGKFRQGRGVNWRIGQSHGDKSIQTSQNDTRRDINRGVALDMTPRGFEPLFQG